MGNFHVELKKVVDDSYNIETGCDLWDMLKADLESGILGKSKKIALITDSTVMELYGKKAEEAIKQAGLSVNTYVFPAGEKSKTRATKEMLEDAMLADGLKRDCGVVALGGGVVTDLAGFLAGTYCRGVPYISYATTVLAAADAAVGGKTAVDTPLATNLIGLFYQPKKVYIDVATWKTLPARQVSSGLAETIKHGCLGDKELFEYLEANMEKIRALDPDACKYISEANVKVKYNVVMNDEREESGYREVLNLGHTVGRAAETLSNYTLTHGEAVSIGLMAQAYLAEKMGFMNNTEIKRLEDLLLGAGLPVRLPCSISRDELLEKLYTDKKVRSGDLRFVLQKGIGNVATFEGGSYALKVSKQQAAEILKLI